MSDTTIMMSIIAFFMIAGFVTPLAYEAFGQNPTDVNINQLEAEASESAISTGFAILFSMLTIFFWTFGLIPLWLEVILFVPLRIILAVLLYRNVRGIGG